MNCMSLLAEQHIREYESRLKHTDELIWLDAHAPQMNGPLPQPNVASADEGAGLQGLGPMAIWDIVARQVERCVERCGG
jgi:hypothetical protein